MSSPMIEAEERPIFSCVCHEKAGKVVRNVYEMKLTPQNLKKFWEQAKQFKVLFWDNIDGDFAKFMEMLVSKDGDSIIANGLFWKIDDMVGVFYMTHIQYHDAQIHYTFFDRRHWGRQRITRMMIQHVFKEFGFHRLSAEIPCFMNGTFDFVKQIGLKHEGRKREAAFMKNEWYDVNCFGILKEEAEKWDMNPLKDQ